MGTRGLVCVFFEGSYRVAQYGSSDFYPGGQGLTALKFCWDWLSPVAEHGRGRQFKQALRECRWITDDEWAELEMSGLLAWESRDKLNRLWPLLSSSHGAKILEAVATRTARFNKPASADDRDCDSVEVLEFRLRDDLEHAADSLFCEWAFVLDLDAWTFEVFKGGNQPRTLVVGERFEFLETVKVEHAPCNQDYGVIRHLVSWPLDALPKADEFVRVCSELKEAREVERAAARKLDYSNLEDCRGG